MIDIRANHIQLIDLPNELLLNTANSLEKEFQILLSLSCRRLRVLLDYNLDLSLCDKTAKLRFLQCLQSDYSEVFNIPLLRIHVQMGT